MPERVVQKEFERLVKTCETDKVKLPTKRQLEKKAAQLHKFATQPMTEVCLMNAIIVFRN